MPSLSRRRFLQAATAAAAVSAAPRPAEACGGGGSSSLSVEEQTFVVDGLHPAHDGLRIVQLSDLHVGMTTGEAALREAVAQANRLAPDLVVLTGDYLSHARSGVGLMQEQLGGLAAPTVAVLGNHDHWVDAEGATKALEGHGYAVLRNQHLAVSLRGEPFPVVGVDDQMTGHADPARAFRGAPDRARLVLAHVPSTAERLPERRGLVCLSGHTHGGQISLPGVTAALSRLFLREPYVRGRFQLGGVQLYVNRGVGNSGVPLRLRSPPELTLVTLKAATLG